MDEDELRDKAVRYNLRSIGATTPEGFAKGALSVGLPRALQKLDWAQASFQRTGKAKEGLALRFIQGLVTEQGFKWVASKMPGSEQDRTDLIKDLIKEQRQAQPDDQRWLDFRPDPDVSLTTWVEFLKAYVTLWHEDFDGFPVLIIDEANFLMSWSEPGEDGKPSVDKRELQKIIGALVLLSKELNLCHVVLVSSDFGFLHFFEEIAGTGYSRAEFIDGFQEPEATSFLRKELQDLSSRVDTVDDIAWSCIFDVCGGNPQLLKQCAKAISNDGKPDEALLYALVEARWAVYKVINSPASWLTKNQSPLVLPYAKLVTAMLNEERPLSWAAASKVMDGNDSMIRELVKQNLFFVCPPSRWAGDAMTDEFFSATERALLPPGPAAFHIMHELKPKLQAVLDWEEKEKRQEEKRQEEKRQEEKRQREIEAINVQVEALEKKLDRTGWWELTSKVELQRAIDEKLDAKMRLAVDD